MIIVEPILTENLDISYARSKPLPFICAYGVGEQVVIKFLIAYMPCLKLVFIRHAVDK